MYIQETNNPFCKGVRKDRTLMCFYERWSSCTFQDALSEANNDVNRLKTVGFPDFNAVFNSDENIRNNFIQQYSNDRAINILFTFNGKGQFVLSSAIPHSFNHVLECSPMRIDNKYYWWRAISSAFLLRPNEDTLTLLKKYHNLALTPSDNCVSLFVRHADKVMEMELLPFQTYAETAKMIIEKELSPKPEMSNEIFGFNGSLFLSTDDPDVIHQAEEWSKQNNWKVVYTHLFDRGTQTARLDWNSQHKKGTVAVHDDLEYFSMLLNLEYSVQCEAWVCTLASNSCRYV